MSRVNLERIALGNVHVHSYSSVDVDLKYPDDKQSIKQFHAETRRFFKQNLPSLRIFSGARDLLGGQQIKLSVRTAHIDI
jgi:hypothetical protein